MPEPLPEPKLLDKSDSDSWWFVEDWLEQQAALTRKELVLWLEAEGLMKHRSYYPFPDEHGNGPAPDCRPCTLVAWAKEGA